MTINGTLLDNFNRTNGDVGTTNWDIDPLNQGGDWLEINSNVCRASASWYDASWWKTNSYTVGTTILEVSSKATAVPSTHGSGFGQWVDAVQQPAGASSTADGYGAGYTASTGATNFRWELFRHDNGVSTLIDSVDASGGPVAVNDYVILRVHPDGTCQAVRDRAGTETVMCEVADTSYTGSGFYPVGQNYSSGNAVSFDDFSAGNYSDVVEHFGVSGSSIVFTPTTAGFAERFAASAGSIVVTPTTSGFSTKFATSSASIVFTPTTAGVRKRFGTSAASIVVTPTAAGFTGAFGASATSIVFTPTTSGFRETFGVSETHIVFTPTTAPAGSVHFGVSNSSIVVTPSTAGFKETFGASASSIVVTPNTAGIRTVLGTSAGAIVVTPTTSGTRTTFGGSSATIVVTPTTAGVRTTFAESSTPIVITPNTAGFAERFAVSSASIVFTFNTAGLEYVGRNAPTSSASAGAGRDSAESAASGGSRGSSGEAGAVS